MFSYENYIKSKNYILRHARPLDKTLFKFEFEDGPKEDVIQELKQYQNDDGGFGQCLEPDIRMTNSSVIATTVAFQYLNEIRYFPKDIINPALDYLNNNMLVLPKESPLTYFWTPIPLEVNESPHAPWWSMKKISPPSIEDWPNPNVEIIGYFFQFSHLIQKELLDELKSDLFAYLRFIHHISDPIYYKFLCFKRILNHVPLDLQNEIFLMLDRTFSKKRYLDPQNFKSIKIQWMITEQSSYLCQKFPDNIKKLIENEIKNLGNDGGSHPTWKWGKDKEWKKIEQEWAGKLTYELLITLKYCGLLEKS